MGLLSFLFDALRRGQSAAKPVSVPQSPRLMTPEERRQALERVIPESLKYGEWQSGSSSWIAALRYNPIADYAQMKVHRGGKVYTFARMSFEIFKAWFEAGSWGGFFNAALKGRYSRF
jgi:hypothetical protein